MKYQKGRNCRYRIVSAIAAKDTEGLGKVLETAVLVPWFGQNSC